MNWDLTLALDLDWICLDSVFHDLITLCGLKILLIDPFFCSRTLSCILHAGTATDETHARDLSVKFTEIYVHGRCVFPGKAYPLFGIRLADSTSDSAQSVVVPVLRAFDTHGICTNLQWQSSHIAAHCRMLSNKCGSCFCNCLLTGCMRQWWVEWFAVFAFCNHACLFPFDQNTSGFQSLDRLDKFSNL